MNPSTEESFKDKQQKFLETLTWYFSDKTTPTGFYNTVGKIRDHLEGLNKNLESLAGRLSGVGDTLSKTNQFIHNEAEKIVEVAEKTSASQGKLQLIVISLTFIMAISTVAYVWITWQSVATMREANQIQRQFLDKNQ